MSKLSGIGIVILNWNAFQDTVDCINSLLLSDKILQSDIFLVDNCSLLDPTFEFLELFPNINYYRLTPNRGYAGGNNYGLRKILEKGYAYALVLNNDTIVQNDFLERLTAAFEDDNKVGLVVPKIKMFYYPNKLYHAGGYFDRISGRAKLIGFMKEDGPKYCEKRDIGFANGCCMLVKREVFERVGLFDEAYFSYGEDAEFSLRVKKAGYKLVYAPEAVIYHKVDLQAKKRESELYLFHIYRAYGKLFRKHTQSEYRILQFLYFIMYLPYSIMKRLLVGNTKGAIAIIKGFFDCDNSEVSTSKI
jgi:GT2 family glycosyltransferase